MSASCPSSCILIITLNIIFKHHVYLPLLISKPVSKCFLYSSSVKHALFERFTFHQFHSTLLCCAGVSKEMAEKLQWDNSALNKNELTVWNSSCGVFFSSRAGRKSVFLAFSWEVARDLLYVYVFVSFLMVFFFFLLILWFFYYHKNMRSSCLEEFVKPLRFSFPFLTTSTDSSCQVESCSKRGKLGSNI